MSVIEPEYQWSPEKMIEVTLSHKNWSSIQKRKKVISIMSYTA